MTRMQLYVHWQPSLMAGKKCSLMERKYSVNAYDTTAQFGTMQNTIEIESLFLRQNTRLKDREIGVISTSQAVWSNQNVLSTSEEGKPETGGRGSVNHVTLRRSV